MTEKEWELVNSLSFKDETDKAQFALCLEIDHLPLDDLPRIYHYLNGYIWDDSLPGKPDGWDGMTRQEKSKWVRPCLKYIKERVGEKALFRYRFTKMDKYTETQFQDWWDSYVLSTLREKQDEFQECYDRRNNGYYGRYIVCNILASVFFLFAGVVVALLFL